MIADARPPRLHPELPRGCRLDNGKPKLAFPTRRAAKEYARQWLGDSFFAQYRCAACGSWHNATRKDAA